MITDEQRELLNDGIVRNKALDAEHREGTADAKKLQGLIGLRCKKFNHEYLITDIRYGYDGYIKAYGKRFLKSGEMSRFTRDIGPITPKAFEPEDR